MAVLIVSEEWKAAYPGATAGLLVMRGLCNPARHPALEAVKSWMEAGYQFYDALRAHGYFLPQSAPVPGSVPQTVASYAGRAPCACGCGGYPKGRNSLFLPGYDARCLSQERRLAGGTDSPSRH